MICLPKVLVEKFKQGLKEGKLNPEDLSKFTTSEERAKYLAKFVGEENAKAVNALFESKLLLKDQNAAMINWVKSVAGMKEPIKRELIDKINKLGKVLTPAEQEVFFQDLASQRLGTEITREQAITISKLAKEFQAAKADPNSGLKYGSTEVALNNYVNDIRLKNEGKSFQETLAGIKKDPVYGSIEVASDIAGAAKGVKASLDNSAIFRQGWKTLFTNPTVWAKNAVKSFQDIAGQLKVKPSDSKIIDGIKAEIYSRANSRAGHYKKMKLDVGNLEEAFPSAFPEKIPLFGRLYQASQTAYTGFLYRMRADIADQLLDTATAQGLNTANKVEMESIGKLINSLTGRGYLGSAEKVSKELNTLFFSPKMLKANLDFLTAHQLQKDVTPFVRKQAATNLVKVVTGVATIMGIAETLHPGSIELDPRSANFGKIKIGETRFDISGGMSSIVTLAARILKNSTKSSTTNKVTKLNTDKFGSQTTMDVLQKFTENKASPIASVLMDLLNRKDRDGKPVTLKGTVNNLITPLPIENMLERKDDEAVDLLIKTIADGLGIATSTY